MIVFHFDDCGYVIFTIKKIKYYVIDYQITVKTKIRWNEFRRNKAVGEMILSEGPVTNRTRAADQRNWNQLWF